MGLRYLSLEDINFILTSLEDLLLEFTVLGC